MLKQNMLLIFGSGSNNYALPFMQSTVIQLFYAVIAISYGKEYYKVFKISVFSSEFKHGGKIEKFKPT